MTPTLYVMNVPEFAPLVVAARDGGAEIRNIGDYLEVSRAHRLVLRREAAAQVRPAIWFAALTGGFVGKIAKFDDAELWLEADD